jgi:DmsE family decaheme c-type cytochrome
MKRSTLLAMLGIACIMAWSPVFADESGCVDCHDEVAAKMANQIHMRIKPFEVQGRAVGCEGCHGDGSQHMEEGDPTLIRAFNNGADDAEACLSCHQSKGLPEWSASTHAIEELGCNDCHSIHSKSKPLHACKECHNDTYVAFELPSHHPVREGRMSCLSCHDPHAASESQLRTSQRLNDLCFTCHQDKEGPFIFEHEPVVESCTLCHTPHGSVANNLLTANEPMLCFQCHEPHFHAGLVSPGGEIEVGGTHRENPFGTASMNVAFTTKCSQCHSQIHGTDLPSQALASGGSGLVR